jgi:N-acetylmuramoyl-L-alanine amidase
VAALAAGCANFSAQERASLGDAPRRSPLPAITPVELDAPRLTEPSPRARIAGKRSPRIALQAGHWRAADAPDEQAQLRTNGTRGGGRREWEVNLEIAKRTAALLAQQGYQVELLPTTVPPGYRADLFIAIHADGSPSPAVSGFRAAAPRHDATGKAERFVHLLEQSYGEATGLAYYPLITNRMRGYYAFNYDAYEHALHPSTVAVILETGFLTSARDRSVIVEGQDRAAMGIAEAVNRYFEPMPREPRPIPQAE